MMAAVHDPSMRFGKDVISTYSDDPEEAAYAQQLYNNYLSSAKFLPTSMTVHLKCSNWLSHQFSTPVRDPDGLTITAAKAAAEEKFSVCPTCGKAWKKVWVDD